VAEWKTDAELYDAAYRVGRKVVDMYTDDGAFIGVGQPLDAVMNGFREDAEFFMSLDPRKIIDEFERLRRAAADTGHNAEAESILTAAEGHLIANWHGAAAEKFAHQMSYARTFMGQQQEQLAFAAHSMGTAYSLAVHARSSYHNIAEATIGQCDNEIAEHGKRNTKAAIGLLGEIAKACITGFSLPAKAGEVTVWALENFVAIGTKAGEVALEGDDCAKVTNSYVQAIRGLKGSFEDGLNQLRMWLDEQEGSLAQDKVPLLEPLPASVDVKGADFSYGSFFHEERGRDSFGPRVEQQRKMNASKFYEPTGPIGERLAGR
jgi:hypothetical protein